MQIKAIFHHLFIVGLLLASSFPIYAQNAKRTQQRDYQLIAHRGGVVDSITAENSLASLKKAAERGYWMVEIDLRLTKDSVFIIHHDPHFKRYYGSDKLVSESNWDEMKTFKGDLGNRVLSFEEALAFCKDNNLQVMVDNKIKGNDTLLFAKVVDLLKKYDRLDQALMIGTEESTPFFTGKIGLSCTRQQLEENMLKPGFNPEHYYLFSGKISSGDAEWTQKHGILTVGVINAWGLNKEDLMKEARERANDLKEAGVRNFQIDSMFDSLF